jgi:hypothetical protein
MPCGLKRSLSWLYVVLACGIAIVNIDMSRCFELLQFHISAVERK